MVKSKLHKFLHRSFPVITAMLLIVLCAAPAMAANSGSWGVPFNFETIALSGNVSTALLGGVPFPLGSSGPTSVQLGGIGISSTFSDNSDGMINVDWSLTSGSYIMQLSLEDVVVPSSMLFGSDGFLVFRLYSGSSLVPFTVEINYIVGHIYEGSYYRLDGFQNGFTITNGSGYDLATAIGQDLSSSGYDSSKLGEYVLLEDLVIYIDADSPFDRFNMRQPHQNVNPSFDDWLNSQRLSSETVVVDPSNPAGVNFVDWLTVAIGGFLDFELWPGMSLNELLWVCLVIGILFTFFKMIV